MKANDKPLVAVVAAAAAAAAAAVPVSLLAKTQIFLFFPLFSLSPDIYMYFFFT